MNEIAITVEGGRVMIGPPSRIPLAGSSLHHPIAAFGRIFRQPDAIVRLRAAWPRLGLGGNAHQIPEAEMRREIEQAGAAKRLVAIYLPFREDIVIDLAWYEDKGPGRTAPKPAPPPATAVAVSLPPPDWNDRWDRLDKIWSALKRTGPRLRGQGQARIADELEALIQPETVAMTLGMIAALMAAHAYGVGEIADIALIAYAYAVAGTQGIFAIGRIADATIDAAAARGPVDLDRVADRYAEAFITLGAAFLSGLLTRMMQRASAKAREGAPGRSPAERPGAVREEPAPVSGKGAKPTPVAEAGPLSRAKLNDGQQANLARFEKKLPKAAEPTSIVRNADGSTTFSAKVPGRVPGSFATYEKTVDAGGNTIGMIKTTVDPAGNIVHVKDKM